ncbi:MAG: hypothetical protein ABIK45_14750 [Pseudomonadota bacterium]
MRPMIAAMVLLLCGLLPLAAGADSGWLSSGVRHASQPPDMVWLALAGEGDRPFAGIEIRPMRVIAGGKDELAQLRLTVAKQGKTFDFDWEDIRFILMHTEPRYRLAGWPMVLGHAPVVFMRDGAALEERIVKRHPQGALRPSTYRIKVQRAVELHGKAKYSEGHEGLDRPVLAVAASREDAEAAVKLAYEMAVEHEVERVLVPWAKTTILTTPAGKREIYANWHTKESAQGPLHSTLLITNGTYDVVVDGAASRYSFHDRCLSSTASHMPDCPPQPRLNSWQIKDAPAGFVAMHASRQGVTLFYRPTMPTPPSLASMLNVGIIGEE